MNKYMNPDLLTPAESRNENRFLGKVLMLYLFGILMFILGYNYAGACGDLPLPDETIQQIKVNGI